MRFMADFETTTQLDDCRVWATCLTNIDTINVSEDCVITNNIADFMNYISKLGMCHEIYFHNLKFDGKFILDYILKEGYTYDDDLREPKTFRCIITDTNIFYSLEICHAVKTKKTKKGVRLVRTTSSILDSSKKIPLPVSKIPGAFGLENAKLDLDYTTYREVGHELTQHEINYIKEDVIIVAKALNILFSQGMEKMTLSSDALNHYKELLCQGDKKNKENRFRNLFPELSKGEDDFIRASYRGGYTYANPKFQGKMVGEGLVYDVNSLYPAVMYNSLLPFGRPKWFTGFYWDDENDDLHGKYPLFIQKFKCSFKVKENALPMIQLKNSMFYDGTEYLTESNGVEELILTSVDLDLFLDCYDIEDFEAIEGLAFRGMNNMFKQYIDHWSKVKVDSEKTGNMAMRQIAKLMLNSLYGKFASNTNSKVKVPFIEEGVLKFNCVMGDDRESIYTAMSSFITSYARDITIRTALDNIDRFAYCDTDSVHLLGWEPATIDEDAYRIGAWKCEGYFVKAKFLRAKTYMEEHILNSKGKSITSLEGTKEWDGSSTHIDVKCAGMPDKCKKDVTFENFKQGSTFKGKLMPKTVAGGVVLVDTEFTIK